MNPPQGSSKARVTIVTVTVSAGTMTGSTAHNLGRTPSIIGRPNPNQLDGLDSIVSANTTDVTVTCFSPVSTSTVFTVGVS